MSNTTLPPALAGQVEPSVMQRADGGAAFPVLPPQDTAAGVATGYPYPEAGMTMRDYFAAKAMHGFICEPVDGVQEAMFYQLSDKTCDAVAGAAYLMADAMLRARAA